MAFDKKKYKEAMKHKGITQEQLADGFGKDIRTINRWLDPKCPIKSDRVRDLCLAIDASPEEFDPNWEGAIETENVTRVSARVSSASKNGYWLLKKLYGVSETEVVELAPTLFSMFAAAIFERTNRGENDERYLAAEILAKEFGLVPEHDNYMMPNQEDEQKESYIAKLKIFGESHEYFGEINPFADEMKKFVKNSTMVKLGRSNGGSCPDSKGTAFDIPVINSISGNDPEISEAISYGQIELFGEKFKSLQQNPEQRIRWMKDCVAEEKRRMSEYGAEPRQNMTDGSKDTLDGLVLDRPDSREKRLRDRWNVSQT
ncbi:MAG: helix-turn-helix transcriptional regulator [Paracoccaceae bacterium]|nr:helix-turn-helix transcriptional regulator [Paracoccaceae bacterium]